MSFALVVLLYIGTDQGTVLLPGPTHTYSSITGQPYNAESCDKARGAKVDAARADKRVKRYRVFCLKEGSR